ncbi:Phosphatidylinositol (PI) 3-kinase [Elasticomyces elasticus]|nr:Phosphatidylinositol (PI) 3-kinase [Elasticomyces elasticus]
METFSFASSSELKLPVSVKIDKLEGYEKPLPYSTLLKRPDLRHRGSNLSPHSDLYITIQLFSDCKPLTVDAQTAYKHFKSSRVWNEWLSLPINYAQAPANSQLAITAWDLSPVGGEGADGHAIPFAGTTIPLFDADKTLRQGRQRCRLWRHKAADGFSDSTTPWIVPTKRARKGNQPDDGQEGTTRQSRRAAELARLEALMRKLEMGEIPENQWLDQMVFRHIEKLQKEALHDRTRLSVPGSHDGSGSDPMERDSRQDRHMDAGDAGDAGDASGLFYLYIEFPRFDHPIVFTDFEYPPPPISTLQPAPGASSEVLLKPPPEVQLGPTINVVDDGYGDAESSRLIRIYDPDVGIRDNPAETKHRKLARSSRTGPNDRDLKPNAKVRDELNQIMAYGPTKEIDSDQRDLVWKFRHHLTREKRALTKLLKSTVWSDPKEVRLALQIMPKWTQIDVDDALELLGPTFDNPDVRAYAVDRLRRADDEELLLYLLQLVQALKFDLSAASEEAVDSSVDSSLATFLIQRGAANMTLGSYLYWYLMVELEDHSPAQPKSHRKLYARVSYDFMKELETTSEGQERRKVLLRQGEFITVLSKLSKDIRFSRSDRQAKITHLKKALADPRNDLVKIDPPLPLPLDPSVMITGCYPEDCNVFKSSAFPLFLNFKTTVGEKYPIIFKTGDDLRQDQLVLQIITLMDRLLLKENLNLQLTPYRCLATDTNAGAVQFVPSASLSSILASTKYKGSILEYLRKNNPAPPNESGVESILGVRKEAMDTYVKSCAGYCVITYLLGVGDRHQENLLLAPDGHFFHIDFGFILGRDPKPRAPAMRLSREMVDGMGGTTGPHSQFKSFKQYCFTAFTTLRKSSNLILNLFALMQDANIKDLMIERDRVVRRVEERFQLELSDEMAITAFETLIHNSMEAWMPVVIDRLHEFVQNWRT